MKRAQRMTVVKGNFTQTLATLLEKRGFARAGLDGPTAQATGKKAELWQAPDGAVLSILEIQRWLETQGYTFNHPRNWPPPSDRRKPRKTPIEWADAVWATS